MVGVVAWYNQPWLSVPPSAKGECCEVNGNWKKNMILFLVSQTISLFGSSLVQYAIMWHITLTTQSGAMMTISIICGFLPTFFLSPFAGVWADRYNRKYLIMLSDALIAVAALVLAILFWRGYAALWLLFAMSAVRALGTAVQTPAIGALLPQLVPEDQLTRVNAINGSVQSLVTLLSPMLSAALLTSTTLGFIVLIDVITAVIAISMLLLLVQVPVHAKASSAQTVSYSLDLRAGFSYIKNHRFVKTLFLFNAVLLVLVSPVAFLTPLQVTRSFGDDVWRLTAIEIAFSLGMMAGGVVMAAWGGFRNRVHTMVLASVVIGACTVALGFVPLFWLYLVFMGLTGVVLPVLNTPFTVMLQQKVEADFLGRVFGVLGMISSSMMPLGMLVFGPLADYIRIEWLLIFTGTLIVVQGLFMWGNRVLLDAGRPMLTPEG